MATLFPEFYYSGCILLHIWDGMLISAACRQNFMSDEGSIGFPLRRQPSHFSTGNLSQVRQSDAFAQPSGLVSER
jgi:hypothetical protein